MSTLTFMTHVCLCRLLPQTNKKVQINSFKTFLPPAYIISCICWTHPEVYTPLGLEGSLPSYRQSNTSAFGRLQLTFFFTVLLALHTHTHQSIKSILSMLNKTHSHYNLSQTNLYHT